MPSPFPGMNPYLEQSDEWEEFHQRFITHMAENLSALVIGRYRVKIETRLYLHELSAEQRRYVGRADASILDQPSSLGSTAMAAVETIAAPLRLALPALDVERYSWVELRDKRNRRIVTAIEILSPTNKKPGPDRDDYITKRSRYLTSGVNLVEIDLLRGGVRPSPPELPRCDYCASVARSREFGQFDCWPITLRDRLPRIPIPLGQTDVDVILDLQELLHRVYDAAQYGDDIYSESLSPSISDADSEWAEQFVPK